MKVLTFPVDFSKEGPMSVKANPQTVHRHISRESEEAGDSEESGDPRKGESAKPGELGFAYSVCPPSAGGPCLFEGVISSSFDLQAASVYQ